MKQFRVWIAIALLAAAILLMIVLLFTPQPIQIILETGQAVSTKSSNYFTITTVMVLVICAFITGASIIYLFYNSENIGQEPRESEHKTHQMSHHEKYDLIIPLLKDDEKKAVHILKEHNGEILQNELVLRLGLSKVKTTRIIAGLERKQIIAKQRHGLTNSIKMK